MEHGERHAGTRHTSAVPETAGPGGEGDVALEVEHGPPGGRRYPRPRNDANLKYPDANPAHA